jgi:hypothetical protein
MKAAAFFLIACGAISGGCSRDTAPTEPRITAPPTTAPPTTAQPPGASNLIRTPPIKLLNDQQLRALSQRCEKYVPEKSARGPYDAAYCEAAMAAWSDAPLQMVPIEKVSIPQSTPAPK